METYNIMKKIILTIIVFFILIVTSCTNPPLPEGTYEVIDTTEVCTNGFNRIIYYDVIIKYDDDFYFATISKDGKLLQKQHEKIDLTVFEK